MQKIGDNQNMTNSSIMKMFRRSIVLQNLMVQHYKINTKI